MKKVLVLLASAAFVALMAISCGGKATEMTPEEEEALIASMEEAMAPVEEKALTEGKWVNNDITTTSYTFKEDGTCIHFSDSETFGGTTEWNYTIDGDKITLSYEKDGMSMSKEMTYAIKGQTLTITEAGFPMDYKWAEAE